MPWCPEAGGPYRLPRSIHEHLTVALANRRNREACYMVATYLARHWTAPNRLGRSFPIDRRALADHSALGLSEARVRGAITTLEAVGFIDRIEPEPGRRYQRTQDGLHRRPILFRIAGTYVEAFGRANSRPRKPQEARPGSRRPLYPIAAPRPSTAFQIDRRPVAHKEPPERTLLLMGDVPPKVPDDPRLAAALERLGQAMAGKTSNG